MLARLRSFFRGVRRGEQLHDDMDAEFRHHMEARTADLVKQGVSPDAAARQARLEFGPAESHKDAGRKARGLRRWDELRVSMLDLKLGARMLAKYPGLTIVGGLAIAFAIAVGATTFEFVKQLTSPDLPLPDGNRIVALTNVDVSRGRDVGVSTRDFAAWRSLRSLEDIGASRTVSRNLTTSADPGEPVVIAEITASAFTLTRTPPLLGRALRPGDEALEAPPVAVIGHDVWETRFAADSAVVGKVADVGGVATTIVGVMPEGYRFPAFHAAWIPLRLDATAEQSAQPLGRIFARLPRGGSIERAQSELSAVGSRTEATIEGGEKRQLRPRVGPFANDFDLSTMETAALWSTNLAVGMLLVLLCGNVGLLMFARAATRQNEIVVRNALGASRARIVMQLFAEALVLAAVAAAVGLGATKLILDSVLAIVRSEAGRLPFWMTLELSPASYIYAAALTIVAAFIAGVLPGLRITAGGVDSRLRQAVAGQGVKFGGIWTVVIVAQVAVTMAFPVTTYFTWRDLHRIQTLEPGFAADEYVVTRLDMDPANRLDPKADTSRATYLANYVARYEQLRNRLLADPAVKNVTYATLLPLQYHPHRMIELDGGPAAPPGFGEWTRGYRVSSTHVDPRFFEVLGLDILAGRHFTQADADTSQRTVIVNETFVKRVLGGHNPIGRQLRFFYYEGQIRRPDAESGPWHEIVGVVKDNGVRPDAFDPKAARVYHATAPAAAHPMQIAIHVRGDPAAFVPTLRTAARDVDRALRLGTPAQLSKVTQSEIDFLAMWIRILIAVSALAIGLSLAGIYAVMSFAVAKHTREIGVRMALGASPRQVITAVFRRPLIQMLLGIGAGTALIAGLLGSSDLVVSLRGFAILLGYALVMLAVCSLSCIVPTRRALRVQPTDALRAET